MPNAEPHLRVATEQEGTGNVSCASARAKPIQALFFVGVTFFEAAWSTARNKARPASAR